MRYCERHGNHFWANCPTCRQHDKLRRISAYCRTLRAQVEELKAELAREREDNRDIPTIAYMSGAADWKARAEAELAKVREASALLVGEEIARANKAVAERDSALDKLQVKTEECIKTKLGLEEAVARVEKLERLVKCLVEEDPHEQIDDRGSTVLDAWLHDARAALAECVEGE